MVSYIYEHCGHFVHVIKIICTNFRFPVRRILYIEFVFNGKMVSEHKMLCYIFIGTQCK